MAQTGNRNSKGETFILQRGTQDDPRCNLEFHVQIDPLVQITHTHTHPDALTGTLLGYRRTGKGKQAMEIVVSPGSFPSTSISTNHIMYGLSLDGAAAMRICGPAVSIWLPLPQTVLTSGPQLSSAANQSIQGWKKKGLWKRRPGEWKQTILEERAWS